MYGDKDEECPEPIKKIIGPSRFALTKNTATVGTDTDLFGSLRLSLKGTRRVLCYPLDHLLHVAGTHLSQAQADLPSACQMIRSPTWAIVKDTLANVPVRCATIGPGDLLISNHQDG